MYLGRRGSATAWRLYERDGGGVVTFLAPIDQLKEVIRCMHLEEPLAGVDQTRHAEMRTVLKSIGLAGSSTRYKPPSLGPTNGALSSALRALREEDES